MLAGDLHDSGLAECQLQWENPHIRLWAQVCTGVHRCWYPLFPLYSRFFWIVCPAGNLFECEALECSGCCVPLLVLKENDEDQSSEAKWGSGTSLCKQVSAMWAWSRQRTSISWSLDVCHVRTDPNCETVPRFSTILQTKRSEWPKQDSSPQNSLSCFSFPWIQI